MWKAFAVGTALVIIIILAAFYKNDWQFAINATGIIGMGGFLLAGIIEGSFNTGRRIRSRAAHESWEDRDARFKRGNLLMMFSIPHVLAAFTIYRLIK